MENRFHKKKPQGRSKVKRTKQEKVDAILLLKKNDYNYSRTARELGVNPSTVQSWFRALGEEVLAEVETLPILNKKDSEMKEMVKWSEQTLENRESQFIQQVYQDREDLLNKARELIEKATISHLPSIIQLIKVTNEMIQQSQKGNESGGGGDSYRAWLEEHVTHTITEDKNGKITETNERKRIAKTG